jgi:hypothetical protein
VPLIPAAKVLRAAADASATLDAPLKAMVPATGAIAVAGKAFAFDAVCDDTMGQARAARRAPACRRAEPFSNSRELRRTAQPRIAADFYA